MAERRESEEVRDAGKPFRKVSGTGGSGLFFSVTPIFGYTSANGRKTMARRIGYTLISVFGVLLAVGPALGAGMMMFKSEQQAQQHCPSDTVVWLNTTNATYHF